MVLTRCHTISKSIASYEDLDDRIDSLSDYQFEGPFNPGHERLHQKYRRETGRTTESITKPTDLATKSKEKITTYKKSTRAKSKENTEAAIVTITDTSAKLGNATLKPMNLFRRIQHKFARKNKIKTSKIPKKQKHKKHKDIIKDDEANYVDRHKRYLKPKPTTDYLNNNESLFKHFKTSHKINNLLFDRADNLSTSTNYFNSYHINDDFNLVETATVNAISIANNIVDYPPPYTSPTEKDAVPQYLDDFDTYSGTASIETLLNKIKLHAMNIISEQSPMVNEMITNTVTETTFDADPLLHNFPGTKSLEELAIIGHGHGEEDVELVESLEDNKKTQATQELQDIKTKATTMASNLEHKLQREIKYALKKAKDSLADGICKACDQVKSVTWKIMHSTATELTTKEMAQETTTTPTSVMTKGTSKEHTTFTTLSTTSKTTTAKATTRQNRATSIGNLEENFEKTTEDDYSMLQEFEDSLAKNHADNVMKMLTVPTPANRPLKDVFKISKRDTETIENLNLKENIRRQNNGEGIPEEDYNFDRVKPKGSPPSVEIFNDGSMSTLTESTLRELATPDNSYAGLINKIHYKEFINGYKHYLNFARDLTKFDSKFSNRVCYQAHRHHNVDDVGKFILTKLPPIPDWRSSTNYPSQHRDKRHFFDSSDIENNDITTKSEESWFRRHFNIFHDKPQKKYHTQQTVTLKTVDAVQKKIVKDNSSERPESTSGESEGLALVWKSTPRTSTRNTQKTETPSMRWYDPTTVKSSIQGKESKDLSKDNDASIQDKLSILDKSLNDLMKKISKATAGVVVTKIPHGPAFLYTSEMPEIHTTSMELHNILETLSTTDASNGNLNELVSALVLKNFTGNNRIKNWQSNSIMESPLIVFNKLLSKSVHSNTEGSAKEDDMDPNEKVNVENVILQEISRIKRDEKDFDAQVEEFDYGKYTTPFSMLFDQAALYPPSEDKFGYVDLNLVAKAPTTSLPKIKKGKYKKIINKFKLNKKKKEKNKDKKLEGGKPRKERHSPLKMLKNLFKISQTDPDYNLYAKTEPDALNFLKPIDIERSLKEFMKQIPKISQPEVTYKIADFEKVSTVGTENYNAVPIDIIMHPILTVSSTEPARYTTIATPVTDVPKENPVAFSSHTTSPMSSVTHVPEPAYYTIFSTPEATMVKKEKSSMLSNNANRYTTPVNFKTSPINLVKFNANSINPVSFRASPANPTSFKGSPVVPVNIRVTPDVKYTKARLAPTRYHVTLTPVVVNDLMKNYIKKYKTESSLVSTPRTYTSWYLDLDNPVLITNTPRLATNMAGIKFRPSVHSTRDITAMTNDAISTNSYDRKYGIQFTSLKNLQNVKDDSKFEIKNYLHNDDNDITQSYGVETILLNNQPQGIKNLQHDTEDEKDHTEYSTDEMQKFLHNKEKENVIKDPVHLQRLQNLVYKKLYTDNLFKPVVHSGDDEKYDYKIYNSRINVGKNNNKKVKLKSFEGKQQNSEVIQDNDFMTETNRYSSYTKPNEPFRRTTDHKDDKSAMIKIFESKQLSSELDLQDSNFLAETNKYNSYSKPNEQFSNTKPYKMNPDYFNDFFNWNRDILTLDRVTSPSIDKIMSTLMNVTTNIDLNKLREDILQMKSYLKYLTTRKAPSRQTISRTTRKVSVTTTKKQNVVTQLKRSDSTGKTRRDNVDKAKFKPLDNFNQMVNNIDKLYSESFKKHNIPGLSFPDFSTTSTLDLDSSSTESPPIEATELAYDDTFSSFVNEFNLKTKGIREDSGSKTVSAVKTKVSPHPKQYFMTPVPMQPTEFDQFLKEHGLDIHDITSPSRGVSDFEEKWERSGNHVESKLMDIRGKHEKFFDFPKKLAGLEGIDFTPQRKSKLFNNSSVNRVVNNTVKFKAVKKTENKFSSDQYAYLDELENTRYKEDNSEFRPLKIYENNYDSKKKRKVTTSSPSKSTDASVITPGSLHFDITIIDMDDILKISGAPDMNEESTKASTLALMTLPATEKSQKGHIISNDTLDFSPVSERYPNHKVPGDLNNVEQVSVSKNKDTEDSYTYHENNYKLGKNLYNVQPKMKLRPHLNRTSLKCKQSSFNQIDRTDLFANPTRDWKLNKSKPYKGKKNKAKVNLDRLNKDRHNNLLYHKLITDKYTTANAAITTLVPANKSKNDHQNDYKPMTTSSRSKIRGQKQKATNSNSKNIEDFTAPKTIPSDSTYYMTTQSNKMLEDDQFPVPNANTKSLKTKVFQNLNKRPKGVLFSSNTMKYAVLFEDTESKMKSIQPKWTKLYQTSPPTGRNRYDMTKLTTTMKTEGPGIIDVNKILREVLGDAVMPKLPTRRRRKAMWRKWKTTPIHKPDSENREISNDETSSKTYPRTEKKWYRLLSNNQKVESTKTTSTTTPESNPSILIINTNPLTSSPILMTSPDFLLSPGGKKKREQRGGDSLVYVVDVLEGSNYSKRVQSATSAATDEKGQTLNPEKVTLIFPAHVAQEKGKTVLNKGDKIFMEKPWSTTLQHNLPRFKSKQKIVKEKTQIGAEEKPEHSQTKAQVPALSKLEGKLETEQKLANQTQAEQTRAEQTRAEQSRAEQNQAEQNQAEQNQAEQTREEQSRAEQNQAEQNRAEQSRAEETWPEQTRAEQNRAEQTRAEETLPEQTRAEQTQAKPPEIAQSKSEPTAQAAFINEAASDVKTSNFSKKPEKSEIKWKLSKIKSENLMSLVKVASSSTVANMIRQHDKRLVSEEPGTGYDFPWTEQISPQYHIATIIRYPDTSPNIFETTTNRAFDLSDLLNSLDLKSSTLKVYPYTPDIVKSIFSSRNKLPELANTNIRTSTRTYTRTSPKEPINIFNLNNDYSQTDLKPNKQSYMHTVKYTKLDESTPSCTVNSIKLPSLKYTLDFLNSTELNRELADIEEKDDKNEKFSLQKHAELHIHKEIDADEKLSLQKQSESHIQKEIDAALDKIQAAETKSLTSGKPTVAEDANLKSATKYKPSKKYQTAKAKTLATKNKAAKAKAIAAAKVQESNDAEIENKNVTEIKKIIEAQASKEAEAKKALGKINNKFLKKTTTTKSKLPKKENVSKNVKTTSKIKSTSKSALKKLTTLTTKLTTSTTTSPSSKKNTKQMSKTSTMTTTAIKSGVKTTQESKESKKAKPKRSNIFKRETPESFNTVYTAKDVAALEVIVDLMNEPGESLSTRQTLGTSFKDNANFDYHPSTSAIQVHIGVPYLLQAKKRSAVESSKLRKVFSAKMSVPVDIEYQVRSVDNYDKMTDAYTVSPNNKESCISPGMYLLVEDPKLNKGFALRPINRQIKQNLVTSTVKTTSPKNLARVTLSKDYIQSINKQLMELYHNLSAFDSTTKHTMKRSFENNSEFRKRRKINWEKVLEYIGNDKRVCNCRCVPNKPMCKACAASDAVITELMFEFENLAKYMSDHCTEIQTFFWMNPTAGRRLRDLVQKIDKNINDYYKRVKGKCKGRPCSCIEKRDFTEPVVDNVGTYIEKALLHEFEDLALSLQQVEKLKLNCDEKFKNIVCHLVNVSQSCTHYKDKRSPPAHKVYTLDNINVNIICNENPSYHETSTYPYNMNDVSTFSFFDYTDDEVKKKKPSKSLKQMFVKRKGKHAKMKPSKRDTIVQIESPIIVSDNKDLWKEYLKDAKEMTTVSSGSTVKLEPVMSLDVLEKTNENTFSVNPRLKATLLKISDINPNNIDTNNRMFQQLLSKRFSRNDDNIDIDKLTTTSESLSNDMKELIKLFENLPGGREVKFTSDFLQKLKSTEKTPKKTFDLDMSETMKDYITTTEWFKNSPIVNLIQKNVSTLTASPLQTRNLIVSSNNKTTTDNDNIKSTQFVPRSKTTSTKDSWFQKIRNKVITITPVFDNNKNSGKLNKINTAKTEKVFNNNKLMAVAMDANIDVNSDITTTSFPTLFIIEDSANHVATENVDQKDSLLQNIRHFEKDTIDNKLTKLKKRDNFNLDEMNVVLLLEQQRQPKSRNSAEKTTKSEFADGDYCLYNSLKKIKHHLKPTTISRTESSTEVTSTTLIKTKTTVKSQRKKSLLRLLSHFKKDKLKAGQRVVENNQPLIKKEQQINSSQETLPQTDEQQRIKEDMDWFLAQFATLSLLDKMTESNSIDDDFYNDNSQTGGPETFEPNFGGLEISNKPVLATSSTTTPKVKEILTSKTIKPKKTEKTTSSIVPKTQRPSTKKTTVKILTPTSTPKAISSLSNVSSSTKATHSAAAKVKTDKIADNITNTLKNTINKVEKTIDDTKILPDAVNKENATTLSATEKHFDKTETKNENTTTELANIKKKGLTLVESKGETSKTHVARGDTTNESILKKILNKEFHKKHNFKEACDVKTEACLCDIRATSNHIVELRSTMPRRAFERYVRNITCYRYMKPPPYFLLELWKRKIRSRDHQKQKHSNKYLDSAPFQKSLRWDWIRRKRNLLSINNNEKDNDAIGDTDPISELDESDDNLVDSLVNNEENISHEAKFQTDVNTHRLELNEGYGINSDNDFEQLYKGEDNVYRTYKRRSKRTTGDMQQLVRELKDLPPLQSRENELFAMLGDKMSLDCLYRTRSYKSEAPVFWDTERTDMLTPPDVVVNGPVVILNKVHARHTGNYTCSQDGKTRTVKLTVITLPHFYVVFIPMYSSKQGCSYEDLRALQRLGPLMSRKNCACAHNASSIKIDEPICLEDKDDSSLHLRATAILTGCQHPDVKCSAQCRRDMQCAFALLCAANAPVLHNVKVIIARQGYNKTLLPSFTTSRRLIVTHTLRKKELQKHPEYHKLAASMYPGNLDIVISCPAGYYLLPKQKICVACPADTYASDGENTCYSCAAGTSSEPGSARCKLSLRKMRRYDWWWYPPCGYALAGVGVLCACVVCTVCALAAHVTSRSTARAHAAAVSVARAESLATRSQHYATKRYSSTSGATRGGPPSPSAVILARFYRASASSSRATDSQETKLEIWKEKNAPPPLPPIDFDLG